MADINLKFRDYSYVIINCKKCVLREIKEYFSFYADGFQFSPKYKYGSWDGKINIVENNKLLPMGLVKTLCQWAKDNDMTIDIDPEIIHRNDISRPEFDSWINSLDIYSGNTKISPYWYQLDAVYESLVNKRRILNLPTSAGKSLIQALLTKKAIEESDLSVLILVPTTALVTQMKDDFIDYRLFSVDEIAEVRSGKTQKNERVVISTWQSAIKKPPEWFSKFGMLLCDEMHLAIGKSISTIINRLSFCEFKIGLSGSLRDGKANLMQYVGLFGSIYSPVKTKELMEDGKVSNLKITALFLKYPENVSNTISRLDYQSEIKFITSFNKRTHWISKLANTLSKRNENVFVMFKNIDHGKNIYDMLVKMGHTKVFYVSGEVDADERTRLKQFAEENTGVVIIASYGVFSTGISVKNLHHVILAHGIKSKVIVLQTIGRVLRKHESKATAHIWDIIDDMSITKKTNGELVRKNVNYLLKHGIERVERYASEQFNYVMKDIYFLDK